MELFKHNRAAGTENGVHDQAGKKLRILVIKYFYPLISLVMLAILIALLVFLYYYAYLSIGHAGSVASLKQQTLEENLKTADLSRSLKNISQKTVDQQHDLNAINDPFERKWEIKN